MQILAKPSSAVIPTVVFSLAGWMVAATTSTATLASASEKEVKAAAFGFDPDDATKALQAAIDSGADRVLVENLGRPWIVEPIVLTNNQEIVFEKGVEVLAKKGAFHGPTDSLFRAHLKQNITLTGYGAVLRMRRDDYAGPDYKKAEWRHVLDLRSCTNVRIRGLTLTESGGDGIYLGTAKAGVPNKDVHIKDVVCDRNYRQGISVINAENLLIEDCVLSNTGGTAPQAGIDFEPNHPNERVVNCTFRRCVSRGNAGSGFLAALHQLSASSAPVSLRFEQCRSEAEGHSAVSIHTGNAPEKAVSGRIEFVDCVFQSSKGPGVVIGDKPAAGCRVVFERCSLVDVGTGSPSAAPIVFSANDNAIQPLGGIDLIDCAIRGASLRKPIQLRDSAGGIGLRDVTGSLLLQSHEQQSRVEITEKQLVEWIPSLGVQAIPRLRLPRSPLKPVAEASAWKPDSLAFARLRQSVRLVLPARQGDEVVIRARHAQVARYEGKTIALTVVSSSNAPVHRADLPFQQETEVRFQAPATDLYRIAAEPGQNLLQIVSSSHPLALNGEDGSIHFFGTVGEFFFRVPADVAHFGIRVRGEGLAEGVAVAILDPQGNVVQQEDNVAEIRQLEVKRAGTAAETWRLRLSRPSQLVLEDIHVDPRGVLPLLAPSPEALFDVE